MIYQSISLVEVDGEWTSHELGKPSNHFKKGYVKAGKWLIARTQLKSGPVVGRFNKGGKRMLAVSLNGKKSVSKTGTIEVLKTPAADVTVEWIKGNTGSPPPTGAVIAGTKKDGTPLYVVESGGMPGYYDGSKKCVRVWPAKPACASDFSYLTFTSLGKSSPTPPMLP